MKKIKLLFSSVLLSVFLLWSCGSDDDAVNIEAPGSVSVESGFGEAIFTWSFLNDSNAEFIRVDYLDDDGDAKHKKFSSSTTTAIISDLEEREYEFTVTAADLKNNRSEAVVVKATPNKPPYLLVANSINAVPDFGGIIISWENETGINVGINVKYIDINGLEQLYVTNSTEVIGSSSATLGGLSADEQRFEVFTTNAAGAKSPSKFFTIAPFYEVKFIKTTWTIIDFSSQEDVGEGPVNGFASAAIDDNTGTFWHSAWFLSSPDFPHYFSVDMKELKVVSKVVLFTRNGQKEGFTKFTISGSLDGFSWETVGEYPFDNTIFTGQSYTLAQSTQMRYIKITALEGPKNFTYLGELDVYGQ